MTDERLPEFMLIGGCPRSGTTPLQMLLNSDPRVYISSEHNLVTLINAMVGFLEIREVREEKADGLAVRALSAREDFSFDRAQSYTFTVKWLYHVIHDIYRRHHREVAPNEDLMIVGDKYPLCFRDIDDLVKVGAPIRYAHITRNPYDVINSMKCRTAMAAEGKDRWKAFTVIDDMIDVWNSAFQTIQRLEATIPCLHIQYEDMVFEQPKTMAVIETFVGVPLNTVVSLIDDPAVHFDRTYLTEQDPALIQDRIDLSVYADYLRKHQTGAMSLSHLSH